MIINMFFCCSISIRFSFLGGGGVRFLFIKFKKYFSSLGYYYEIPSIGAIRLNTQVNTHSVTSFMSKSHLTYLTTCVLCPLVVECLVCRFKSNILPFILLAGVPGCSGQAYG